MINLINGYPQGPNGLIVPNGHVTFQLNVDATVIASPHGFVGSSIPITFQFNSLGQIQPNLPATQAQLYSNLELNPQNSVGLGTYYLVTFYDQNGAKLNQTPMWWQFTEATGSTVDISDMIPYATVGGNVIFYPIPGGGSAAGVSSLNTLTGAVVITAGSGITVTPSGSDISIVSILSGTISSGQVAVGSGSNAFAGSSALTFVSNILNIADSSGAYQIAGVTFFTFFGDTTNIGIGSNAGGTSYSGAVSNTAIGANALGSITSGQSNVGIGSDALSELTTGVNNLAIGDSAGLVVTTGIENIAIGHNALYGNQTGETNIAIGISAGLTASGSLNILIGVGTGGSALTTGSSNILIGNSLNSFVPNYSNQLNIGDVILGTGLDSPSTSVIALPGSLQFIGSSSGSVSIGVGANAGSSHKLILPPSTGSSGQALVTDGGNPQQLSWATVAGSGTVTSVGFTGDGVIFNTVVSASPITGSGTLVPALLTQTANYVLAGPTSGGVATPTFRALVAADIPSLAASSLSNGVTGSGAVVLAVSPALTGTPTAPTVGSSADNSTKIATTAFVQSVVIAAGSVTSVFGRSGGVVATSGDYSFSLISGKAGLAQGGTNADLSATGGTSQVLKQVSSGAAITVGQLAASDLSNGVSGTGAIILAASPTLTGAPAIAAATATTAATTDSSTKVATTAYVQGQKYAATFASTTSLTIAGATHGLGTADLQITIYNSAVGTRTQIVPSAVTVDSTVFDVVVTFTVAQAGRIVISAL